MSTDNSEWLQTVNASCHRRWWWFIVENTDNEQYFNFVRANVPRLQAIKQWGKEGNLYRLEMMNNDDFKTVYSIETDRVWPVSMFRELLAMYPKLDFKVTLFNALDYYNKSKTIKITPKIGDDLDDFQLRYVNDDVAPCPVCTYYVEPLNPYDDKAMASQNKVNDGTSGFQFCFPEINYQPYD